jgi:hypothetical protein
MEALKVSSVKPGAAEREVDALGMLGCWAAKWI